MMMDKVLSDAEWAKEILEQSENRTSNLKTLNEHMQYERNKSYNEEMNSLYDGQENFRKRSMRISEFSTQLKENLLQECFVAVFDKIMKDNRATQHECAIGRSMISKFIKEEGAENLLLKFEDKNLILSEFARYTNKYHSIVMETVGQKASSNDDDDSCFVFDKEVAQEFIDDIKDITPQKTIDLIRDRVEDSIQTFIDTNAENKMAIKDIYTKTKASIKPADSDAVKEEYAARARFLSEQVYSKPCSVFSAMVNAIGESVITTPALQQQYMEGTKIKFDALVEDVKVMYTVLEMVNTLNAVHVNEEYIKQIIIDLKE